MIDHIYTLACRVCCIDRFSNNVSLIEILEQLTARRQSGPEAGRVPAQFDVVSLWERVGDDPVQGNGRTSIVAPDGQSLLDVNYTIDLIENQRFRHRWTFVGFPARMSGRYIFRSELQTEDGSWRTMGETPVQVEIDASEDSELLGGDLSNGNGVVG